MNLPTHDATTWANRLDYECRRLERSVRIMEICGTHTHAIGRAGLRALFPNTLELVSGPGCPVCVTSQRDIERALLIASTPGVTVCTFGDMLRVPGNTSSLEQLRASGADIRVVYSPDDAVELARLNPALDIVFLGIGFETTAPGVAASILRAASLRLTNFRCMVFHKRVAPVLAALLEDTVRIDGFLLPGHVCVIMGAEAFAPFAARHGTPCVAAGFAPGDIMEGLTMLMRLLAANESGSFVQYERAVRPGGNLRAREIMDAVFEPDSAEWRGLGVVSESGMRLRAEFSEFDAMRRYPIPDPPETPLDGCLCGQVLRGILAPADCPQFGKRCSPRNPMGPCMVSSEGSCAARYRYG